MANDLLRWRREASMRDWDMLAELAGTSRGYLAERLYDRILDAVTIVRVVSDGLERVSLRKEAVLV